MTLPKFNIIVQVYVQYTYVSARYSSPTLPLATSHCGIRWLDLWSFTVGHVTMGASPNTGGFHEMKTGKNCESFCPWWHLYF